MPLRRSNIVVDQVLSRNEENLRLVPKIDEILSFCKASQLPEIKTQKRMNMMPKHYISI